MAIELVSVGKNQGYTCPADAGEPGIGMPRVSVTDHEGVLLAEYAAKKSLVLELGTGLGVSTRYLASTAGIVYTCDIDPWVWANVWPTLAALGNVHFCTKAEHAPMANMIFIDAMHDYESVCRDLEIAHDKLIVPGQILVHDTRDRDVKQAVMEFVERPHLIISTYGIGVLNVK